MAHARSHHPPIQRGESHEPARHQPEDPGGRQRRPPGPRRIRPEPQKGGREHHDPRDLAPEPALVGHPGVPLPQGLPRPPHPPGTARHPGTAGGQRHRRHPGMPAPAQEAPQKLGLPRGATGGLHPGARRGEPFHLKPFQDILGLGAAGLYLDPQGDHPEDGPLPRLDPKGF